MKMTPVLTRELNVKRPVNRFSVHETVIFPTRKRVVDIICALVPR